MCAIAGVCRDARGTWAMVTLASQPGGARTEIAQSARLEGLSVDASPYLRAGPGFLYVDVGERLEARFAEPRGWPRRPFGPLGPAQVIPGLGQYWAPHLLGARVSGHFGDRSLDGTSVYAEKNWGAAFADHWWWGQGPGVAFAGGRIHGVAPTAVAAWTPDGLVTLSPPFARTVTRAGGGEWHVRARSPRWRVEIEGEAIGSAAAAGAAAGRAPARGSLPPPPARAAARSRLPGTAAVARQRRPGRARGWRDAPARPRLRTATRRWRHALAGLLGPLRGELERLRADQALERAEQRPDRLQTDARVACPRGGRGPR